MYKGYVRCSTNETKQDLTRQIREIQAAAQGEHIEIFAEYEHGQAEVKQEQARMLNSLCPGDTIIVTEISRLTRSTRQLCDLIEAVKQKHVRLQVLNSITIDCRQGQIDPMSQAFLQIAGVFAELERSMISDRVKSGLENARAKGKRLGRPTLTAEDIPTAFYRHLPSLTAKQINKSEFARLLDVSRPTLDKWLAIVKASTVKAPRKENDTAEGSEKA